MIKDITLGQYYPADSLLHRLDPRTKIILTFVYISCIFILTNFISFAILGGLVVFLIKASAIPFKFICKGIKPVLLLILITAVLNIFSASGTVIYRFYFWTITKEGIITALIMVLRITFLVTGTSFLTYTTSPIMLTDGIEKLLEPFKKFGMPAHELAMMMSIALRFIPTLIEETDKITKAQSARGASFDSGKLLDRAKSLIPVLIPLFISAFRRADDLAVAMESRCYRGGENRTRMKQLEFTKTDIFAFAVFVLSLAFIIAVQYI